MLRASILVLVLGLGFAPSLCAQDAHPEKARPRERIDSELMDRWNSLSEPDRDRLRAAFREFQKLPEEERARIRARAIVLAKERRRLEAGLGADERETLGSFGPDVRSEWLKKAVWDQLRLRQRHLEAFVPRARLEELSSLPDERRHAEMREIAGEVVGRVISRSLEYLERKEVITAEERARLETLPTSEAARELLALRKRSVVEDLDRKPDRRHGLTDAEWAELKLLPPETFFDRLDAAAALSRSLRGGGSSEGRGPWGSKRFGERHEEFEAKMRARVKQMLLSRGLSEEQVDAMMREKSLRDLLREHDLHDGRGGAEGEGRPPFDRPRGGRSDSGSRRR